MYFFSQILEICIEKIEQGLAVKKVPNSANLATRIQPKNYIAQLFVYCKKCQFLRMFLFKLSLTDDFNHFSQTRARVWLNRAQTKHCMPIYEKILMM